MATVKHPTAPGGIYTPPNPDFKILTARPLVRFLSQAVQPPSSVYVTVEDVLRITAVSSQANEKLTVSYRLLLPDGKIVLGQSTMNVSSDRAINIHDEPLAEGFLLSVSCRAAVATTPGATFARMFLTSPSIGQGQPSYMLMADYVTTRMAPGYPNGRITNPTEGAGGETEQPVASPGAGADWSFTVPTNAYWRVTSISAILACSGAVATRFPLIAFKFGGAQHFFRCACPTGMTAGQNFTVSAGPACGFANDGVAAIQMSFPDGIHVVGGDSIGSETVALDAADQYSAIAIRVEDYFVNA